MSSRVSGELDDHKISSLNRFADGVDTGIIRTLLRDLDQFRFHLFLVMVVSPFIFGSIRFWGESEKTVSNSCKKQQNTKRINMSTSHFWSRLLQMRHLSNWKTQLDAVGEKSIEWQPNRVRLLVLKILLLCWNGKSSQKRIKKKYSPMGFSRFDVILRSARLRCMRNRERMLCLSNNR